MKNFLSKIFAVIFGSFMGFFLSFGSVFAADKDSAAKAVIEFDPPAAPAYYPKFSVQSSDSAGSVIGSIIAYGIGITAILAVIAVTWAGIQMFLSVGDQAKYEKAKELMIYALVGVGVSGAAYLLVRVIAGIKLF